jgi:hypothetical protein
VRVTKTHVTSEEQARAARFASSPTVRINGTDIQLESRESFCEDCGKLCKEASVKCREWRFHDAWFKSPPKGLFLEAIIAAMNGDAKSASPAAATTPFDVPDNLKRFFAAKKAPAPGCCAGGSEGGKKAGCCESRASTGPGACCEGHGDGAAAAETRAKFPAAACTLSAESRVARKQSFDDLRRGVVERRPLINGLSLRFRAEPGIAARLGHVIDLERDCCQFLSFALRSTGSDGSVWLDVVGTPETKTFIDENFGQ